MVKKVPSRPGSFREAQEAERGRLVKSFHEDEEKTHRERLLFGESRLSRNTGGEPE